LYCKVDIVVVKEVVVENETQVGEWEAYELERTARLKSLGFPDDVIANVIDKEKVKFEKKREEPNNPPKAGIETVHSQLNVPKIAILNAPNEDELDFSS